MTRLSFIALLAAAACATAGKAPGDAARQAERSMPAATELPDGPERAAFEAARAHEAKGDGGSGEAAR
ncbi:MAG TPA: hypothetical protein VIV57_07460, partial [Anaeromyxobacter sp.]